jgi:hypothetical protein
MKRKYCPVFPILPLMEKDLPNGNVQLHTLLPPDGFKFPAPSDIKAIKTKIIEWGTAGHRVEGWELSTVDSAKIFEIAATNEEIGMLKYCAHMLHSDDEPLARKDEYFSHIRELDSTSDASRSITRILRKYQDLTM